MEGVKWPKGKGQGEGVREDVDSEEEFEQF